MRMGFEVVRGCYWVTVMLWPALEAAADAKEWSLTARDELWASTLAMCLVTLVVLLKLNFRRPRASRPGSSSAGSVSSSCMSMLMTDVLSGDADGVRGGARVLLGDRDALARAGGGGRREGVVVDGQGRVVGLDVGDVLGHVGRLVEAELQTAEGLPARQQFRGLGLEL